MTDTGATADAGTGDAGATYDASTTDSSAGSADAGADSGTPAAHTITAASCSFSDVSAAVNSAAAGDVVSVPPGSCTWSSTLTLAKSLTLKGAGSSATTIFHDSGDATVFVSPATDVPIRVTGFTFDKVSSNNGTKPAVLVEGTTTGLTKVRIDHNTFHMGDRTIFWIGWAYGVTDHNLFVDCDIAVGMSGGDNASWLRPIAAGTADAVFIEDNTFVEDDNVQYDNEEIYLQEGARTTIRHNTFDGSSYSGDFLPFDSHGNQNYFTGGTDFRGQPLIEFYDNTVHAKQTYRMLHVRGGSLLIHDNTFLDDAGSTTWIQLEEEECYQSAFFSPLRTAWPAEDQINNTFIWNNTGNGSPITDAVMWESCAPTFIQKDRDYFMHAPQATGGRESWPDRQGSAHMTFSASGANAYYPYTPYAYPHPLTTQ